jgi:glycosyltransferase involved in cell wall biosynthesis
MPAYNEEEGIEGAVQEVNDEILSLVPDANLVVIDDGSKDKTGEILDRMAAANPRIKVIHKPNSGHGPSLVVGLRAATGEFVFMVDSDRQIPLNCFPKLWNYKQEYDAVFGIRRNRQDPAFRVFLSSVINCALRLLFGVTVVDANVPCKLLKKKIWDELDAKVGSDKIMAPSLLIAVFARKYGYKVIDVEVGHQARSFGVSTLKIMPLMRFCWKGFTQLLEYRGKLN